MSKANTFETEQLTDSAYYILLALLQEQHGYAIMKYIDELTSGQMTIGPATLYTLLKRMSQEGLIKKTENNSERKKEYIATEKGIELINKEVQRRVRMAQHGVSVLKDIKERLTNEK